MVIFTDRGGVADLKNASLLSTNPFTAHEHDFLFTASIHAGRSRHGKSGCGDEGAGPERAGLDCGECFATEVAGGYLGRFPHSSWLRIFHP